jgi:cysteinyl-tRNA synthetase
MQRVTSVELRLYDTLTREKRVFTALDPARVRMYVCGPTVYDFAHIGNARPVIVFDVLFRLLRHLYGADKVTYVRNITDVDDKINARAAERGVPIRALTEETYQIFKEDAAGLGCLPPTVEPRATEHIEEMKVLIGRLIASGNAYVAEDHVLFSVPSMPDYGRLSKRSLDEMMAGARVDVAPYKRDPMDFVLWKPSKQEAGSAGGATGKGTFVEPAWDSPAGIKTPGRPGWHIECSAMSWKHLGETFDVHGGGIDLVFPHHENEIAQSRCAFHTPIMANYWMHNGFLQLDGEKMSKSLGNISPIREVLREWPGEAIRLAMLRTLYRQPLNWSDDSLLEARKVVDDWYAIVGDMEMPTSVSPDQEFIAALAEDLNTPAALARLHALASEIRGPASGLRQIELKQQFKVTAALIGLLIKTRREYLHSDPKRPLVDETKVINLIAERTAARARKDWKESDRIRDELAAMGVVLKDSQSGTTWELAR